jgi:hypothetical protein
VHPAALARMLLPGVVQIVDEKHHGEDRGEESAGDRVGTSARRLYARRLPAVRSRERLLTALPSERSQLRIGEARPSCSFAPRFGLRPLPESPSNHLVGSRRRGAIHFRGQRSGGGGGGAIWAGRASGCGFDV